MSHMYIHLRVYVCTYGELTVDWSTMMHICCGHNFRPFHSSVRGIEVESGKEDQIAIDDSGLDVDLLYII